MFFQFRPEKKRKCSVVDPDGERESLSLGENLLFGKIFAENCMKMKEIGPRGGAHPLTPPPGSANAASG